MKIICLHILIISSFFLMNCNSPSNKATATESDTTKLFDVLVFSRTTDYRHKSIEAGKKAIMKLGQENRFKVDTTEDANSFRYDNLMNYKVVVFLNIGGVVLDEEQKRNFEKYIANGGAFVGVHGATAAEYDWEWYGNLIGAFFDDHPKVQKATIKVVDRNHPSTKHLPEEWIRTDEWYNFRTNPKDKVNVLLTLDESTYEGGKHSDVHPISWYHIFNGARSWYTGLGHTDETYEEPLFLDHLLGGIMWAAGDDKLNM